MYDQQLKRMRDYFESGVTRSYNFRRKQLEALRDAVRNNEDAITNALYADLKKSAEEVYITETGLLYAEITNTLKNLKKWMKPKGTGTNLANLPSSSKLYRDPLGVVLIIAPWNYPLQLSLIPLVGAIAGGNCAVIKPSEFAPATAAVMQKIISSAFPAEYIFMVEGDGAEVVPEMMNAFRFDHIFYTGSIPVGRAVYTMAAEKLIPVTLELGGKSPAIVEADANIVIAAKRIIMGKFLNAGQTCIAPDYVLAHTSVKGALIESMKKSIEEFYGADTKESYEYGKIINEKRFDKLVSYLNEGNIVEGGQYDKEKLFIAPTILDEIKSNAALMHNEIFGPLLPVLTFANTEDAIQIVKQHSNPLAFYLFTANKTTEQQWINSVPFGGGCINNTAVYFTNHHLPFGGVGNSGTGQYHGKFTFDTFTRLKPVMKTPVWFNPSIKYPPFKGKLKLFKWFIK
ncbi:MAG TPA: aldehyde dehydrogenase [Chitinophagaceae bacterium]|nr:aldehyde dehydrogenase [Chitinophagaceae bacterium]